LKIANQSLFSKWKICDIWAVKFLTVNSLLFLCLSAGVAAAPTTQKLYRWVDNEGVVHYGDSIPAEYSDLERQVLNEHGITVDVMQAKRTAAELAEEKRQEELRVQADLQRRADQNLLATYLSVDEILLHRDRRVELFKAQARVTELYIRNLQRRMDSLRREAANFRPYSADPDAPIIDPDLADDMAITKETIARHELNLQRFQQDELNIVARFEGDIDRFRQIKGLN
jgi:uncharacterized protein DUF4124